MKVDFEVMAKIAYMEAQGCPILGETGPVLGGYCGGPKGTAVAISAYHLFANLILRASMQHPFVTHYSLQTCSSRDVIWARSVSGQAITRNSQMP